MTEDETGELPDNKLFEFYEQYIGEPDAQTDVYLGFGLFFVGVAFAVIGLGLFVWAGMAEQGSAAYWDRRLPAFVLGMLSIPTAMLSVSVLLPVKKRATYGGAAGMVVCLVAVGIFVSVYPGNWNVQTATDYSVPTTALYAVGMAVITASAGAALIAHHLAQARPGPADIEAVEDEDDEETYTTEQIEQDIENAMDGVDLSWGGVEKQESTRLSFSSDEEFETSGIDVEAKTTRREGGVDSAVSGLKQLKGGDTKTETSESTVDDQTAKLKELRERKRKEESADDDGGLVAGIGSDGLVGRVKSALRLE